MKVFISQPMRGKTDKEIKAQRNDIIAHLREKFGEIEVIESFFEDYNPETGNVPLKYLAKSIELLADADLAYFANGWEAARGCQIENECAIAYGIDVIEDYRR